MVRHQHFRLSLLPLSTRVVLPLGTAGVAHLFAVDGCQGAKGDPEKLSLADQLLTSVLCATRLCCSGQPVIFSSRPQCRPLGYSLLGGRYVGWRFGRASAIGKGVAPSPTRRFQLDDCKGPRRDFASVCTNAIAASTSCTVLSDRSSQSSR